MYSTIIKDRVEKLEAEYTFEEISYVYEKLRHHASLRPGIARQIKQLDEETIINEISKKLAEKYAATEEFFRSFREPAKDMLLILKKSGKNLSFEELISNLVPEDIDYECRNITMRLFKAYV